MNSTIRTLILVTLVGVGAFAGSTVATSHASVEASPSTPGETATHTITVMVENDSMSSLEGISLDYSDAGVNLSNVSTENITVGIDRGGDNEGGEFDENITDDVESVEPSTDGEMLNLTLGGTHELSQGDEIVVEIENVQNPDEAGDYTVGVGINPGSNGGEAEAMLTISESGAGTGTANETETETETEMGDTETETETEMGDTETETEMGDTETEMGDTETDAGGINETGTIGEDETITEGPGFGVVVAVLAVLGAAFIVVRKRE